MAAVALALSVTVALLLVSGALAEPRWAPVTTRALAPMRIPFSSNRSGPTQMYAAAISPAAVVAGAASTAFARQALLFARGDASAGSPVARA